MLPRDSRTGTRAESRLRRVVPALRRTPADSLPTPQARRHPDLLPSPLALSLGHEGPQRGERAVVGRAREPSEAECCGEEPTALVEHALFDDLIRALQYGLRNRQPQRLRGLEVDHQVELGRLFHGKIGRLRAFQDLVHVRGGVAKLIR